MTLSHLIAHEWRTRLSRPAALAALALYAVVLIAGAVNGRMHRAARVQAVASQRAEVSASTARWLADLRALEAGAKGVPPWAGSAMDATFATHLPPAPLEDFAIGQSDLLPTTGAVSLWSPDVRLFTRYELDDPVSLSLGGFDIGKAVLLVLPLLLVVLCFDVLSGDRDAGRLGLVLAQGVDLRRLVWGRLAVRAGAVLTITVLVATAALIAPVPDVSLAQRLLPFAWWIAAALLHALVWIAVIALVAARNRGGDAGLTLLLFVWAGLELLVPAAAASAAEAFAPPPSRLALLARARELEIQTERREADIARGFLLDHPDLIVEEASQMPAYVRTAYFVTAAVDRATRPVLVAFDQAAARREDMLSALRYASPAIVMHGLFNEIAGTSSARHRRYVAAARAFKADHALRAGRSIVAGRRMPLDQAASLPGFQLEEERLGGVLRRSAGPLLFLVLAAGALLVAADRRLRRVVGPS